MAQFNANYLKTGTSWIVDTSGYANISLSYLTSVPSYYAIASAEPFARDFQPLTSAQMAAVDLARDMWAAVTNINWIAPAANAVGAVTFGVGDNPTGAHLGFIPTLVGPLTVLPPEMAGDVWFLKDSAAFQLPTVGSEGFDIVLHEVGHALGLSHDGTTAPISLGSFSGSTKG